MSRDRERPEPDPESRAERAALVTAYVDGVAELPVDERRAVEAWLADDPAARAQVDGVRALLGQLRELPPRTDAGDAPGGEPDWAAMERAIRQAVADEPVGMPWWRRWQWLVPAMTCATAAAVLVVLWPRSPADLPAAPTPAAVTRPQPAQPDPAAPAGESSLALWLDGSELDVDLAAAGGALGEPLGVFDLAAAPTVGSITEGSTEASDDGFDDRGLLPADDLAWIDRLDDAALDRAERWLAGSARPPGGGAGNHGRKKS